MRLLGHDLYLDHETEALLRLQSQEWAECNLSTSGIAHRPPILSGYVSWLVRETGRLGRVPRAYRSMPDKRIGELKVRYSRAVAPWSPRPHRYDGPPKVPRAELCLRRTILTEFPKNGDAEVRHRSLQACGFGIISAVEKGEILDSLTISSSEVGKLQWLKPADAERYVRGAQ